MTKKDVLELKRRFKKSQCTFTKMCGCYVNGEKEIVLTFDETFLNLEDDEMHKYLEIANKTLSGTVGNNLLELEFPLEEEQPGGKQQLLMGLRESRLKNPELLETFYHLIIDSYDYAGNFLILVYHDAYDVMKKTSDNQKLDESEEVYEYLMCTICPVTLSKPGLGYLADENRIGPRIRDWVVNAPDTGFTFPAFTDRSTDIHSVMFYTKDAKEPHIELAEDGLGCLGKPTATQQKNTFQSIINSAVGDDEASSNVLMDIQDSLTQIVDEQETLSESAEEPIILTNESVQEILTETGLSEDITERIQSAYEKNFGEMPPAVEHLIDSKILKQNEQRKKEKALAKQVIQLQEKLEETTKAIQEPTLYENTLDERLDSIEMTESSMDNENTVNTDTQDSTPGTQPSYDVFLRVKPEKVEQIKSQIINGKKCIIIPMDEDEHANVNGLTNLL